MFRESSIKEYKSINNDEKIYLFMFAINYTKEHQCVTMQIMLVVSFLLNYEVFF